MSSLTLAFSDGRLERAFVPFYFQVRRFRGSDEAVERVGLMAL
jgi:hypothetical protein